MSMTKTNPTFAEGLLCPLKNIPISHPVTGSGSAVSNEKHLYLVTFKDYIM